MPFADYVDFDDCVSQNADKDNPEAYCASIEQQTKVDVSDGAGMLALYVPPGAAESMAIPGGELPEELHVTLLYLPDSVTYRNEILNVAAKVAGEYGPINASITGTAEFYGEDAIPSVLLVDSRELLPLHLRLAELLPEGSYSTKHGYIPHITLEYHDEVRFAPVQRKADLQFEFISAVIDGERTDYPLRGAVTKAFDSDANGLETVDVLDPEVPHTTGKATMDGTDTTNETQKVGRRMQGGMKNRLTAAVSTIADVLKWATYDEGEKADDDEEDEYKTNFQVVRKAGERPRWIMFSSNAFRDKQGEIIATKALADAVAYGEETDKRGPLLLWHVPAAKVGECDFQAIQGRFLIESGTFDDTEIANKTLAYIESADEELGGSIGFFYPEFSRKTGVYEKIRIAERSLCPQTVAANPWTSFTTLKGVPMEDRQKEWLKGVVGADMVATIIETANKATEELEQAVAFKTETPVEPGEPDPAGDPAEVVIDATGQATEVDGGTGDATDGGATKTEPEPTLAITADDLGEALKEVLGATLAPIGEAIKTIAETNAQAFQSLNTRLEAIEQSQKEKTVTRGTRVFRATESDGNLVDKEKVDAIVGSPDPHPSPVAGYIMDVTGAKQ